MSVRVVAITKPEIEGIDTAEDFIAYAARVSNPGNQNNTETASKLVRYLINHKHWSPFEMVMMCVEIKTTRDISRQILRHRSFTFQEFSQRYAGVTSFVKREPRMQDHKNRQNSLETDDFDLHLWWDVQQSDIINHASKLYREALDRGIAKEQARAVLPEGLTETTLYMNGTLRSWIHWYQQRSKEDTQKEHREIAIAVGKLMEERFPNVMKALRGDDFHGVN